MKKKHLFILTLFLGLVSFGQTPTLTISGDDAPANGSSITDDPETATPGNATIDFDTTFFNVGEPGTGTEADGYIVWSAVNVNNAGNNDGGNIYTANDGFEYTVTGLIAGETYDFSAELVDNAGASLIPAVVYAFTIIIAEYIDVANITALRAGTVDPDTYYRVTGQVINTKTDTNTDQIMYFQDATGGIKVFDGDYEVQSYNTGDAVSNIRGHLESVNGVLQFVPTFADWGTPDTTGNSPGITTVTIATLLTNWEDYESELVNINGVTFADGNNVNTFASGVDYSISDGSSTLFRTIFNNVDYITNTIPTGSYNITAIVSEENGTVFVTSRDSSDFTMALSLNDYELDSFKVYPNPTNLGYINISSISSFKIEVYIFDLLGKQVANETTSNNKLDVSSLNAGIYIMKMSQDETFITKKLVIQ